MGAAGSTQRRASDGAAAAAGPSASGGGGGAVQTVRVIVPAGMAPGQTASFTVHGRTLRAVIPPGAVPGSAFDARLPPAGAGGGNGGGASSGAAAAPPRTAAAENYEHLVSAQLSAVSTVRETLGIVGAGSDDIILAALAAQGYDVEGAVAALLDAGGLATGAPPQSAPLPIPSLDAESKEAPGDARHRALAHLGGQTPGDARHRALAHLGGQRMGGAEGAAPRSEPLGSLSASQKRSVRASHLEVMSAASLSAATNAFDASRRLGAGGFGAVYRARYNGVDVAIKKLDETSMQGATEFASEVSALATLKHRNLILLLGYAAEADGHCLVYELARGGSVEERLACGVDTYQPLSWSMRLGIAIDVARGLAFLHGRPAGAVVHGDVKTANVLLTDPPIVAKLCDFGLVRLVTADAARRTASLKGSWGYIDPEYARTGTIAPGSDVYSFGVVLLELMSGLPANESDRRPPDLATYARERSFGVDLLDGRVERDCPPAIAKCFAQIVAQCLAEARDARVETEALLASLVSLRDTARGGGGVLARPPGGASFLARLADAKS